MKRTAKALLLVALVLFTMANFGELTVTTRWLSKRLAAIHRAEYDYRRLRYDTVARRYRMWTTNLRLQQEIAYKQFAATQVVIVVLFGVPWLVLRDQD